MKIIKMSHDISIVEENDKRYVRLIEDNKLYWGQEKNFNYQTNHLCCYMMFTEYLEDEFNIEYKKEIRLLKLNSI